MVIKAAASHKPLSQQNFWWGVNNVFGIPQFKRENTVCNRSQSSEKYDQDEDKRCARLSIVFCKPFLYAPIVDMTLVVQEWMSVVSPTSRFAYIEAVSPTRPRSFRLHDLSRFTYIKVVSPTLKSKIFREDRWTPLPTSSGGVVFDRISS